jgi:crotonobetainyl-CoA:carnitine CoA-transferase CaiB-like acyl-CoA transferase
VLRVPAPDESATALLAQLLGLVGEPPMDADGPPVTIRGAVGESLDGAGGISVSIHGADPVLPTPFAIGEVGAAVIAACALLAARIWRDRTGQAQASRR